MTSPEDKKKAFYFDDLILFLAERRPNQKCSVCGQSEGWKFHAESNGKNPAMSMFEMPARGKPGHRAWVDAVCIECPNCADMNYLGVSTVLKFIADRTKNNG